MSVTRPDVRSVDLGEYAQAGMSELSEDYAGMPVHERKRPSSRTFDFRRTTQQPVAPHELHRQSRHRSHSRRDKKRYCR